jgi:hypothetical protein
VEVVSRGDATGGRRAHRRREDERRKDGQAAKHGAGDYLQLMYAPASTGVDEPFDKTSTSTTRA